MRYCYLHKPLEQPISNVFCSGSGAIGVRARLRVVPGQATDDGRDASRVVLASGDGAACSGCLLHSTLAPPVDHHVDTRATLGTALLVGISNL